MQYKNNILYTDLKEVSFDFPIKQVLIFQGLYIVVISPLDSLEYPSNIFAVNNEGDIVWRIKSFNTESIIFNSIEINTEKGKLYGKDINHFKYVIDAETGNIISGKLRPLDDDEPIKKSTEVKIPLKKPEKINLNILKNNKFLTIILFVGFFIFMSFIAKNIKINSLKTEISRQQTYIETLEQTLLNQEQAVLEKQAKIKELETIIIEYQNYLTNNTENTKQNPIIQQEILDSSISNNYEDNINEIEQTNNKNSNTREKNVNNGVSTVIDFLDSFVENVSTGTPITTEDVKEMNMEVSEGYHVTNYVDGQRIKVSLDGEEEFIVKLISVSNCKVSTLEKLIPIGSHIYIENDSKKYNDDGEMLAYVWVTSPDEDNLNAMVNYAILKSGSGTFVNESPNIKYNRHFF